MRIHSNTPSAVNTASDALHDAKDAGLIPAHVVFDILHPAGGSRTHRSTAEVHLSATFKAPGDGRRYANTGHNGANRDNLAATYDEWGFFLAALFTLDPSAKTPYDASAKAFSARTAGKYSVPAPAAI